MPPINVQTFKRKQLPRSCKRSSVQAQVENSKQQSLVKKDLNPVPDERNVEIVEVVDDSDNENGEGVSVGSTPNIIAKIRDVNVQLNSIVSLTPNHDINDEIIEFGLNRVYEDGGSPSDTVIIAPFRWGSFFKWQPKEDCTRVDVFFKAVKKQAPNYDLLGIKYLVIPVIQSDHWQLAIICNPFPTKHRVLDVTVHAAVSELDLTDCSELLYFSWINDGMNAPKILFFDSLSERCFRNGRLEKLTTIHKETALTCIRGLAWLHRKYWEETSQSFMVNLNILETHIPCHTMNVTGQRQPGDCGIYCIMYLKVWLQMISNNMEISTDTMNPTFDSFNKDWELQRRLSLFKDILQNCKENFVDQYATLVESGKRIFPGEKIIQ